MQCFDYSVIGTLVGTEDGQRLILAFFKDEFHIDINSDPSISTTQHGTTTDAVFMRGLQHLKSKV